MHVKYLFLFFLNRYAQFLFFIQCLKRVFFFFFLCMKTFYLNEIKVQLFQVRYVTDREMYLHSLYFFFHFSMNVVALSGIGKIR